MTAGSQISESLTKALAKAQIPSENHEEELIRMTSGASRGASSRKGTWYVEHPISRVRQGSARSLDKRREGAFCPCGMQLSLTGACANCD